MMKIALFTCHRDPNYGSMLQAYALYKALQKMGFDSEYIDYTISNDPNLPLRKIKRKIKWPLRRLRDLVYPTKPTGEFGFLKTKEFADLITAYKKFHMQYIPVSTKKYYSDTIRMKFDVSSYDNYIVGSDQTWSPILYNPKAPYFLDLCDFPRKNSYAPSFGTVDIPEFYISILKQKLKSFDNISCRELVNSIKLSQLLDRKVNHVLDPTLLLSQKDWDEIAKKPVINGDYVLAYILGEKDCVINFAERLGRKYNLPVYYIVTRPKYLCMQNSLNGVGPADWIGLIKGARYIVTDSYHGCLFSVNYCKDFYAFSKRDGGLDNKDNIRIIEFLKMIGLESRFQDGLDSQFLNDIDYNKCNNIIIEKRDESIGYLYNCVHK